MKIILVSGATGLVGSALLPSLREHGCLCKRLVRTGHAGAGSSAGDVQWDPNAEQLDPGAFAGVDAVVHLAGENIAGRWSAEKKEAIRESRVRGTRLLAETLAGMANPPATFVCASAIGYYGSRGGEILTEASAAGSDFLAEVCHEWEAAAAPATKKNIRVVNLRLGVVLSAGGGALKKMLPPFRLGLGGPIGNGKQYWSWIAIGDVIGAIEHALNTPAVSGAVNVVAPNPATNAEFTAALGRALHRPAFLPMPAFAAHLLLGEMADALLLASTRVKPEKLVASGYTFKYPELDGALEHILQR